MWMIFLCSLSADAPPMLTKMLIRTCVCVRLHSCCLAKHFSPLNLARGNGALAHLKGKASDLFHVKKKPSLLSVITRLSHQVCDDPSFRSRRPFKSRRAVQVSMVTGSLNDNKRVLFFYSGLLRYQVNMGSTSPQGQ